VLEPDRSQLETFLSGLFRYATPGNFISLRSFYEDRGALKPFLIDPIKLNGNFSHICDCAFDGARRAANADQKVVFAPPVAVFTNASRHRLQPALHPRRARRRGDQLSALAHSTAITG
jgi:hypothetical protein